MPQNNLITINNRVLVIVTLFPKYLTVNANKRNLKSYLAPPISIAKYNKKIPTIVTKIELKKVPWSFKKE
jgi:hypothetical protein